MGSANRRTGAEGWLLCALLFCCGGCTISVQPCRWRTGPDTPPVTDPTLPPGVPGAAAANAGRPPGPVPPGAAAAAGGTSSEQMAMMMQRLASSEDDRKALAGRLQQLETQLREKDQAVVQTSYEVQESTKQMKRTRDDLARWKQDMDGLRTKLASIERENKLTLEAILKTLEQYIDREKDDKK